MPKHKAKETRFSPPLDSGIAQAVIALYDAGVETFESCEGGKGHAYREPTVRFHGDNAQGLVAFAIAIRHGFKVENLRRIWRNIDGELTGPYWEMTFFPSKAD